jgi:hypothetical protein
MSDEQEQQDVQVAQPPPGSAFGWNPISRRYVKRSGAVYKRLVMSGVIRDAEVSAQLEGPPRPARERRNNVHLAGVEEPTAADVRNVGKETATARRAAKKLIARHVDRLEGLPPDQVEEIIRRLLAEKLGNIEPEPAPAPARRAPAAKAPARQAVRVKLAPVAAPRRRATVADLFSTTEAETTAASDDDFSD